MPVRQSQTGLPNFRMAEFRQGHALAQVRKLHVPNVSPVGLGLDPGVGPKSVLDPLAEPIGRLDRQLNGPGTPANRHTGPRGLGVGLGRRGCLEDPADLIGFRLKLTEVHREARKITVPHEGQQGMRLKPGLGLTLIIHDAIGLHVKLHPTGGPYENLGLRTVILPPQAVWPDPGKAAGFLDTAAGRRILADLDEGPPDPGQLRAHVPKGLQSGRKALGEVTDDQGRRPRTSVGILPTLG
jgi:hypothetical protein